MAKKYIKIDTSVVDGLGVRVVIYFSGCSHHCYNCHNKFSWDPEVGQDITNLVDEVKEVISTTHIKSITLSGGDPLYGSDEELLELLNFVLAIKTSTDSIWMYTGYTYDDLIALPVGNTRRLILDQVDVLVDGRYVDHLRDPSLCFRGSSNQRLINIRESTREGKVVEVKQI
jgi:anaerobic ribonucleoside-triphosphate reductase activating protein